MQSAATFFIDDIQLDILRANEQRNCWRIRTVWHWAILCIQTSSIVPCATCISKDLTLLTFLSSFFYPSFLNIPKKANILVLVFTHPCTAPSILNHVNQTCLTKYQKNLFFIKKAKIGFSQTCTFRNPFMTDKIKKWKLELVSH